MLDYLPVQPNGGTVVATGVCADLLLNQPLPFGLQFGGDPASHRNRAFETSLCLTDVDFNLHRICRVIPNEVHQIGQR